MSASPGEHDAESASAFTFVTGTAFILPLSGIRTTGGDRSRRVLREVRVVCEPRPHGARILQRPISWATGKRQAEDTCAEANRARRSSPPTA